MNENDTIAAISTPYGTGAIAIVRMSGREAFGIAARVFTGRGSFEKIGSHRAVHGKIVDPGTDKTVDEVLLVKMSAPDTYTGEDVVEINCHGGLVVQQRILELLFGCGARPAEPGEFSRRSFLNGKMDLSQAEAVIDLINAKTALGSRTAVRQLEGELSATLKDIRRRMVGVLAHIEVTVDYPEHDMEEMTGKMASEEVGEILEGIEKLIGQFQKGRILREGITAVIAGRPNVGKSSLLNRLAGKERAIVTDIPGTTRDLIDEYVSIGGIPVRIVDTAGIRETRNRVEGLGVERTYGAIRDADLVILMLDAVKGEEKEEKNLLDSLSGRKHIVLLNKIDLIDETPRLSGENDAIPTSMKDGTGIDELEKRLAEMFLGREADEIDNVLLTNARHKYLLEKAASSLEDALGAYEAGMPLDIMTIDIREAAERIGEITGESVTEEVIGEIFSRFCVGK